MLCRFCESRLDAEPASFFESEDRLAPIVDPEPSFSKERKRFPAGVQDVPVSQPPIAEPTGAGSLGTTALMVVSVLAALGSAVLGVVLLTRAQATVGVGFICAACFLGILIRVLQAGRHHRVLIHALSNHR